MAKPTLITCKHCRKRFPAPGRGMHVYCSLRCCIFDHVIVAGQDDCWQWTATTGREGYGVFTFRGKIQRAHRAVYELINGPIGTSKLYVCHTCDNRGCCNPAHLWLGTVQDNLADMRNKGRGNNQFNYRQPG